MKQLGLSLVLLSAVSVASASRIDTEVTINGIMTTKSFEFEGPTLDVSEEFEGYFFKAHATQQEDGVIIENEISTRNEAGEVNVISQPVVHAVWGQESVLTLGDETGHALKLVVNAHQ